MASQIEICNMAIGRVGSGVRISSINGPEDEAIVCNVFWDQARDVALAMAPWKCAAKRTGLARNAIAPDFDWAYKYNLPEDYIRLIEVKDNEPYVEEEHFLLSDANEIHIKYVYRLTTTGRYHPLLVDIMSCRLAQLICVRLAGSKNLRDSLFIEANQMLLRGEAQNAFEPRDAQKRKMDRWLAARFR